MTKTDQWRRVQQLFDDALAVAPAERERWLDATCGRDGDVRAEVASLLRAHVAPSPILTRFDSMATRAMRATLPDAGPEAGTVIGRYFLLRRLGSGGMGVVFLASRDDGTGPYALKIVRVDRDAAELTRRLAREAAMLNSLDHAGIARLVEIGETPSGASYLVMEYVEGTPITEYCVARPLGVRERMRLMVDVSAAVGHAHARGIMHRDLKPAHLVVCADGRLVILDFGIAKPTEAASPADALTRSGVRLFTPEYAAPEQIYGDPVGPAADVYALGVICYELLTSRRPADMEGRATGPGARALTLTPTAPPSAIAIAPVSREIDAVIMRALEPEPARRYGNATELCRALARAIEA